MKKFIASIAVIIYFAFSCGVIVNYHFCMDRYDSFQLYKKASDECGRCGMHISQSHGCCHDEVKVIKLSDDHQTSSAFFAFKIFVAAPENYNTVASQPLISNDLLISHPPHGPPGSGIPIYLQNQVFRI